MVWGSIPSFYLRWFRGQQNMNFLVTWNKEAVLLPKQDYLVFDFALFSSLSGKLPVPSHEPPFSPCLGAHPGADQLLTLGMARSLLLCLLMMSWQEGWLETRGISSSLAMVASKPCGFKVFLGSSFFPEKKNEGVEGSKIAVLVTQLCLTLCDPMNCSPPGASVHGILPARILELVAMPFSRRSSQSRGWTQVSSTAGGLFTIWAMGKPPLSLRAPRSGFKCCDEVLCLMYCRDHFSLFLIQLLLYNIFIYCLFGSVLYWAARGITVPRLEIKPVPPALGGRRVNHWAARGVSCCDQFCFPWNFPTLTHVQGKRVLLLPRAPSGQP